MEGFTATHPSGKEEWVVSRHGARLRKATSKLTSIGLVYSNIITTYFDPVKSLGALHAEKRKAVAKGFHIINFDATTDAEPPKVKPINKRRVRIVKVLGRHVPVED